MFLRLSPAHWVCLLVTFVAFAAASTTVTVTAPATTTTIPASQCGTGDLKCCGALERSDGSLIGTILALLGVVLEGVEALIGIKCVPINILDIGQNECAHEPVCCSNQNFDGGLLGIIAIGCVPINIHL